MTAHCFDAPFGDRKIKLQWRYLEVLGGTFEWDPLEFYEKLCFTEGVDLNVLAES